MVRFVAVLGIVGGCATTEETLACGLGTGEVDGRCEILETPVETCPQGQAPRNGQCVGLYPGTVEAGAPEEVDGSLVYLPFAAGRAVHVSQGFHGAMSHSGSSSYALDFPVPVGTPVHAIRAGRVVSFRESSDEGCGDPSCATLANNVVVDHGDGTFALYVHLQQDGALVELDQVVARGEPIALSGNTGFSTGPHLHLEVRDIFGSSQPLRFAEFLASSEGVPYSDETVRSLNEAQDPPASAPFSTCPTELFAFLGVMLDPGVSCSHTDGPLTISGRMLVDESVAMVSTLGDGLFQTTCAEPGDTFSLDVDFGELGYWGLTTFAVSAADPATCQSLRSTTQGALVFVR